MPELPEVEVVRRGLMPYVAGRVVKSVVVREPREVRRHTAGAADFSSRLTGARLETVARRGKFLWCPLLADHGGAPGQALVVHLGMSGQARIRTVAASAEPDRHVRIRLELEGEDLLDLVDQRIFGGMWIEELVRSPDGLPAGRGTRRALLPASVAHIARDLLDPRADFRGIAAEMGRRRAPIKSLLLSQEIVSGIGNIYADEGLWEAGIRYDTPGLELGEARIEGLLAETAQVMRRALDVGGTSFDSLYVNVDGRSGYFARSLAVYGKAGQPCPRCGTPIGVAKSTNRSCYYCERCQERRFRPVSLTPTKRARSTR